MDLSLYNRAVLFAVEAHRGQKRIEVDGETDYVVHPLRVAEHLSRLAGCDETEILAAAVLHDTIEDSGTRYDELAAKFGERVARIVCELTNDSRLPKHERHEDMIRRLAAASPEAKLIKLADRYDNLQSAAGAYARSGGPGTHEPHAELAAKRRRLIEETPRLLASLRGACPALEAVIERLLAELVATCRPAIS